MVSTDALLALRAALLREEDQEPVHLYPIHGKGHITKGYPANMCWCDPEPDDVDPRIIIHNSSH